jgi:hypothetical protein
MVGGGGLLKLDAAASTCSEVSHVTRHTSHVTRHTSHVTRHTSHAALDLRRYVQRNLRHQHAAHRLRQTSHVTRHTSHVTRHTSHVTRHTSHVTRHTTLARAQQHQMNDHSQSHATCSSSLLSYVRTVFLSFFTGEAAGVEWRWAAAAGGGGDDGLARDCSGMSARASMRALASGERGGSIGGGGGSSTGTAAEIRLSQCCCCRCRLLRGDRDADATRLAVSKTKHKRSAVLNSTEDKAPAACAAGCSAGSTWLPPAVMLWLT